MSRCVSKDKKESTLLRMRSKKGTGFKRELEDLLKFDEKVIPLRSKLPEPPKFKLINQGKLSDTKHVDRRIEAQKVEEDKKPLVVVKESDNGLKLPSFSGSNELTPLIYPERSFWQSVFQDLGSFGATNNFNQFYSLPSFGAFQLNGLGQWRVPNFGNAQNIRELNWQQRLYH